MSDQSADAELIGVGTDPATAAALLRKAFGCFPSGVVAICAAVEGRPIGLAASSFISVSLDPPLVAVCIEHTSTTWPQLRSRPRLGLSVLAEGQHDLCARLASKTGERFSDVEWRASNTGSVVLPGASLWLDYVIHPEEPSGDHDIVLLRILGLRAEPDIPPLVFHRSMYRRLAVVT